MLVLQDRIIRDTAQANRYDFPYTNTENFIPEMLTLVTRIVSLATKICILSKIKRILKQR
jgi:hypothetical protein